MEKICIYTDGACSGNPGPGGWAAVIKINRDIIDIFGSEKNTTNNRMELKAVISALNKVHSIGIVDNIELYTDSQYVKNGITVWIDSWVKNNWVNSQKQPVKNQDLWKELLEITNRMKISWNWVKGHAGHEENERADSLARSACMSAKFSDN